jgi:Lsr2
VVSKTVTITVIDDLDGSVDGVETTEFGIDGKWYEIDLSASNRARRDAMLAPYIEAARKVKSGTRRATVKSVDAPQRGETRQIREWAKQHGKDINDRGRLPREVLAAWRERKPELLRSA